MDVMNQVLIVVQSAAIPLLAVIMAIVVINMMKGTGKTTAVKEDSFKVTESAFWLVIALFGVAAPQSLCGWHPQIRRKDRLLQLMYWRSSV